MLLPRILTHARAAITALKPSYAACISSSYGFDTLRSANAPFSPTLTFIRHATHQAQGRANGAKDGPGKRLGAKKTGGTQSLFLAWLFKTTILFQLRHFILC